MIDELTLTTGPPANGGSCVARHEGRVVFVRYALPDERVRVRVVADHGSYWHADVVEVLEASPDRVDPLCPIAGVDGAGCCDLAFAAPEAARRLKGAVVANQLAKLGGYHWRDEADAIAEPVGSGDATGWRTRVRLDTSDDGHAGFHRYHSAELVTDLRCGQLPQAALDGLSGNGWPAGAHLYVALDDDGARHVVQSGPRVGRRTATRVVEGGYEATQRVNGRVWRVPVTAFWQAHRDAAQVYSDLVAEWAQLRDGMVAWDLYGGAGVFAAVLGRSGRRERAGGDRRHVARRVAFGAGGVGGPEQRLGRHRFGAPCPGGPVPAGGCRGARPAAVGCGPRGDRSAGRRRGTEDHPHRLRGSRIRSRCRVVSGARIPG